jgi:hypothetical protein
VCSEDAIVHALAADGLRHGHRTWTGCWPRLAAWRASWATRCLARWPRPVPATVCIGEVDTVFKLIGPDHKIVVEAYDDPKVGNGVTCYVSRAKTGGIKGALGLAEDKAEASIACRQVGPISFTQAAAHAGGDVHRTHLAGLQEAAGRAHGRPPSATRWST